LAAIAVYFLILDQGGGDAAILVPGSANGDGLSEAETVTPAVGDVNDAPAAGDDMAPVHFETAGASTAETLWEDDFSDGFVYRWPTVYHDWSEQYTAFEHGGETWVRVTYPKGSVGGGFHLKTKLPPAERLYLQYQLRFGEDFDFVRGGKLPGFYGGAVTPGVKPNGESGFVARPMWGPDGTDNIILVYHMDAGGYGEGFVLDNAVFQRGVVQTLGLEVVMNTPGQADGIVRAWLDGVLVLEVTDLRFRTVSDLQIDGLKFDTFFGGNDPSWAPTKDETIEFGDFTVYSEPPWEGGPTGTESRS
jgi:hypothetical protein